MKKKKITFSEPNCRFGCPHFKSVGSVLNETCEVYPMSRTILNFRG